MPSDSRLAEIVRLAASSRNGAASVVITLQLQVVGVMAERGFRSAGDGSNNETNCLPHHPYRTIPCSDKEHFVPDERR